MGLSLRHFLVVSAVIHAAAMAVIGFSFPEACRTRTPPALAWCGDFLPACPPKVPAGYTAEVRPGPLAALLPSSPVFPDRRVSLLPARPALTEEAGKTEFIFAAAPGELPGRKGPVITIHPLLPEQLQVYFKDRQSVHLELMFKVTLKGSRRSIAIRRKISSGSLDADLLCSRYLGHYLFMQEAGFEPGNWQTVKIDLSR